MANLTATCAVTALQLFVGAIVVRMIIKPVKMESSGDTGAPIANKTAENSGGDESPRQGESGSPLGDSEGPRFISITRSAIVQPDEQEQCSFSLFGGGSQGYAKYHIVVSDGHQPIWRRYSQFRAFHRTLIEEVPNKATELTKLLPEKGWSNNLETGFVEDRSKRLQRCHDSSIFCSLSSLFYVVCVTFCWVVFTAVFSLNSLTGSPILFFRYLRAAHAIPAVRQSRAFASFMGEALVSPPSKIPGGAALDINGTPHRARPTFYGRPSIDTAEESRLLFGEEALIEDDSRREGVMESPPTALIGQTRTVSESTMLREMTAAVMQCSTQEVDVSDEEMRLSFAMLENTPESGTDGWVQTHWDPKLGIWTRYDENSGLLSSRALGQIPEASAGLTYLAMFDDEIRKGWDKNIAAVDTIRTLAHHDTQVRYEVYNWP